MHLVITDSGLGGLGICAAIEKAFRHSGGAGDVRLTYFNAWPEEGCGYNLLPDEATRLGVFDRALDRMGQLRPDRIVIACNTLSVLFDRTRFAHTARISVLGIIDAGVNVFHEALSADQGSAIALFGTRITMESGVHRDQLMQRGIASDRIVSVPCHGLAAAIEKDAGSAEVERLIDACTAQAAALVPHAGPVLVGLCCTHYRYVADRFRESVERVLGRTVRMLDPNGALVRQVVRESIAGSATATPTGEAAAESTAVLPDELAGEATGAITVEVISKVAIGDLTRNGIGRLVEPTSPSTARALQSYTHVPDLF